MTDLKNWLKKFNKEYSNDLLQQASEFKKENIKRVPTGSLYLDRMLSLGSKTEQFGWPLGRIIQVYGPQMSGKSTLALRSLVESQKRGKIAVLFDAEKTFTKERADQVGLDMDKLILSQETMGELVLESICNILKDEEMKGKIELIVVDSIASLIPKAEVEKALYESNRLGLAAQMFSQGLRKLVSTLHDDVSLLFINQLRENPGAYGNPEYTPGGRALGYYSAVMVDLRSKNSNKIKSDKKVTGQITDFRVVKNKTGDPFEGGSFKMYLDGTFDQYDELINIGLLDGKIKKKGAYIYVEGIDDGWHGQEKLEEDMKNKPELFEKIKKTVFV